MARSNTIPDLMLRQARAGEPGALGELLEFYRNYLELLARTQIGTVLKLRLEPSDIVQETFLDAHRDFGRFRGSTEKELVAWLRQILVRNLLDQARRQRAQLRDLNRQKSLDVMLDRSSTTAHQALAAVMSTPSGQVSRREQAVLLADALAQLPEDFREVIILRHLERLSFGDVASRMGRSAGAVRMLWVRAIEKLRGELESGP